MFTVLPAYISKLVHAYYIKYAYAAVCPICNIKTSSPYTTLQKVWCKNLLFH